MCARASVCERVRVQGPMSSWHHLSVQPRACASGGRTDEAPRTDSFWRIPSVGCDDAVWAASAGHGGGGRGCWCWCVQMCCILRSMQAVLKQLPLRSVQADYSGAVILSPQKTRRSGLSRISTSSAVSLWTINHDWAFVRVSRELCSRALSPMPHLT